MQKLSLSLKIALLLTLTICSSKSLEVKSSNASSITKPGVEKKSHVKVTNRDPKIVAKKKTPLLGVALPPATNDVPVAEKALNPKKILATGKVEPTNMCPLATIFGMKPSKTVNIVKKNQFNVCANLSQTCCAKESLEKLKTRWMAHTKSQSKLLLATQRIGRLMIQLEKNLNKKAKKCIKADPKLVKKLNKKRRLVKSLSQKKIAQKVQIHIPFPSFHKIEKKKVKKLDCTHEARNFRLAVKGQKEVQSTYEQGLKRCNTAIESAKSRMMCMSCDPTTNKSIQAYNKKVRISTKDFERIKEACIEPYWLGNRRQKPWYIRAFKYARKILGKKKMLHAKYQVNHQNKLNPTDCFPADKIEAAKKSDLKWLGLGKKKKNNAKPTTNIPKKSNRMLAIKKAIESPVEASPQDKLLYKKKTKKNLENDPKLQVRCDRATSYISRQAFKFNKKFPKDTYKILKMIIDALGNNKIKSSFDKLIPKSQRPVKKVLKTNELVRKLVIKKIKSKNINGPKKIKKIPVDKHIKAVYNPITTGKHYKWQFVHHRVDKKDRKRLPFVELSDYIDTGLAKISKVKSSHDQLVDKLTK